jgi:RND family efflux transporter MFP subunit
MRASRQVNSHFTMLHSSRINLRALCWVVPALATVGCQEKPTKAAPAAVVTGAIPETQLATVKLTADAVRRLGITTVVLDSAVVTPTRTVGGEIVVPPGGALTVTAPVAGTVFAPASGTIPPGGARVVAGQALMRLVALPPDLARTGQDVSVAEARLRQAQAEADRVAALFADRLVAGRDQERAQADLAAARAALELATGQQRAGRGGTRQDASGLNALVISAPNGGVVRALSVGPGQAVAAGTVLAEIVRIDRMWVRVALYAGDAGRVARGADVTVHGLSGPGSGTLLRASPVAAPPSADPLSASVDLYFELRAGAGAAALRPGERVGVTLPLTAAEEKALVAPLSAVVRDMSGGAWVYEQTDSLTFVRRRIDIRRVSDGRAVLAMGPKVGTRVVNAGAAELFGTEFGTGK